MCVFHENHDRIYSELKSAYHKKSYGSCRLKASSTNSEDPDQTVPVGVI